MSLFMRGYSWLVLALIEPALKRRERQQQHREYLAAVAIDTALADLSGTSNLSNGSKRHE